MQHRASLVGRTLLNEHDSLLFLTCRCGDSADLNFFSSQKSNGPCKLSFSLHGLSAEARRLARSERLSNGPTRLEPKKCLLLTLS